MSGLVFITGASSGIGQALALRYYQAGFTLALVARRTSEIQAWAMSMRLDPQRYRIDGADVAQPESIIAAAQRCIANQGLPDVVIANAGISIGMDSAIQQDLQVLQTIFAVNNIGMAATFHPFIAPMTSRGSGTLVGIGSVAGVRGIPGHGAYCASKSAVMTYCESLRGEMRGCGVRVVILCPGYIDTPLTQANAYAMPFLMPVDAFASRAFEKIRAGRSFAVIPWQMAWIARLLRVLPDPWMDRLFANRPRKGRAKISGQQ